MHPLTTKSASIPSITNTPKISRPKECSKTKKSLKVSSIFREITLSMESRTKMPINLIAEVIQALFRAKRMLKWHQAHSTN
jgi:hypothetical protein